MQLAPRLRTGLIASLLLVCIFPASSVAAARPPELKAMVLRLTDLPPGTKTTAQGYDKKPSFVAAYSREFELSRRYGRSEIGAVLSSVDLTASASEATGTWSEARRAVQSPAIRRELAMEIVAASGGAVRPKDVTVSRPLLPINTRPPAISGSAAVGQMLVTETGTWDERLQLCLPVAALRRDRWRLQRDSRSDGAELHRRERGRRLHVARRGHGVERERLDAGPLGSDGRRHRVAAAA